VDVIMNFEVLQNARNLLTAVGIPPFQNDSIQLILLIRNCKYVLIRCPGLMPFFTPKEIFYFFINLLFAARIFHMIVDVEHYVFWNDYF
jgi:hypothetical protein